MSNLTKGTPPQPYGQNGRKVNLPVQALAQIYEGAMVAQISGACCTGTTALSGPAIGIAEHDVLGGAADGSKRLSVMTDKIFIMKAGVNAPLDSTPYGAVLYMEDDNSVGTGQGSELQQIAGRFMGIEDDGRVRVYFTNQASWFDSQDVQGTAGSALYKARAVVTSIAAYGGSGTGVLTASANGAIGAQDGVTLVAGDVVFLPAGITHITAASDAGPYVVTSPGGAGKFVLTRPIWWETGAPITSGQEIGIGPEGTVFKGVTFKAMCGKGKVVDTDDATLYPNKYRKTVTLAAGTYTIGAGGGNELLFLFDTTLASVQATVNTPGGTLGTNKLDAPAASRIAGYPGTAAVVINDLNDDKSVSAATSTVDVLVTNW